EQATRALSADQPNGQSPVPTARGILPGWIDGSTSHFFSTLLGWPGDGSGSNPVPLLGTRRDVRLGDQVGS
ncbi:MAG: hypothetical protein AB1451_13350, partial [Nitrospirota bacterium]